MTGSTHIIETGPDQRCPVHYCEGAGGPSDKGIDRVMVCVERVPDLFGYYVLPRIAGELPTYAAVAGEACGVRAVLHPDGWDVSVYDVEGGTMLFTTAKRDGGPGIGGNLLADDGRRASVYVETQPPAGVEVEQCR